MKFKIFIFSLLFSALSLGNVFAAGYSCPAYMKYTSCNAGYYMTKGGSYNATPQAGNTCTACPSGYNCAGGTANAVPACSSDCSYGATRTVSCGGISNGTYNGTQTCNATKGGVSGCYTWGGTTGCSVNCNSGYVPNGASCENCGWNYYCNNNTRYSCPANNQNLAALSGGTIISQGQTWTASQPNSTTISNCYGDTQIQVATGKYLAECPWNGTNYYNSCAGSYLWYEAATGYYLSGYISTSSYAWYSGVAACTNKPANSYYTGAGSADTNNCPWACNSGYQKTPSNTCILCPSGYSVNSSGQCQISVPKGQYVGNAGGGLITCPAGYYCPGATINYGTTGSVTACTGATYSAAGASACTACPSGYTANTAAGKTAASQCQISVAAGKYLSTVNTATTGSCAAGTSKAAHTVNYGSTSSCAACAGRTQYSGAGASACSTVSAGYYTTGCSGSNNCTGQAICTGTTYCTDGIANECPSATTYKRTTFPAHYYSPVINTTEIRPTTGLSSISGCRVLSWLISPTRGKLYEYADYNASSGKYDLTIDYAWYSVNPGYYLTDKAGCSYAYYSSIKACPAGSYCPGKAEVVCNPGNQATVHTTNFGLETCPIGAYCGAGATAPTLCADGTYQDQTGQTSCKACPSGDNVQPTYSYIGTHRTDTAATIGAEKTDRCYKAYIAFNGANCVGTYSRYWSSGDGANASYYGGIAGSTYVTSCNAGYYAPVVGTEDKIDGDPVGAGYYSPAGAITRTACPAGLTTIGFGTGADEVADCGRILNIGSDKLYLRSAKKTTPSLNVGINGTTYYGNMDTSTKGKLRINSGGTQYSVFDDSM